MKKILLIVLLVFCSSCGWAQNHVTWGKDFWLSFLYYYDVFNHTESTITYTIFASGSNPCTFTVSNPNTSWSTTATVTPGNVTSIVVPNIQVSNSASGAVGNYGLHVTATDTISLYTCMSSTINSAEMTCVLPTPSLGKQYMVQCYPAKTGSNSMFRSQFCVVATENNTHISVHFTGSTENGISSNSTHYYTLNAGQVIRFRGTSSGYDSDLTGSTVEADKNVAVFSGHFCAYVPYTTGSSCDHIFDQHLPVTAWGTRFVARTTAAVVSDRVRIMPRFNNTDIYINGNYVATTNAGQIYETTLSTTNPTAYIETCGPALVYLFLGSTGNSYSDPSMMPILPVDQMAKDITFGTYHTQACNTHYINIIAETSEVPSLRLDNNSISSYFQTCSANPLYSTAQVQLSEGAHRLRTLGNRGFLGYACSKGSHESYAYSVGSRLITTNAMINALYVDGNIAPDTMHVCQGKHLEFMVGSSFGMPDSIRWYVNGHPLSSGNTFSVSMTDSGCFEISSYVYVSNQSLCHPDSLTIYTCVVCVHTSSTQYDSDVIPISAIPWHKYGRTYYDEVTNDTIRFTNMFGCDSLIIYSLQIYNDTLYEEFRDTICAGEPYSNYGFDISSEATSEIGVATYQYVRPDTPYVATLYLTQLAPPSISISYDEDTSACYHISVYTEANHIEWSSDPEDPSLLGQESLFHIYVCPQALTNYSVRVWYDDYPECYSEDNLLLEYHAIPRTTNLWVPNVFTPDRSTNNLFRAYGVDIEEFEMYIFQRWGERIYHSQNMEEGWDGTFNGVKCPGGNYVYLIYYRTRIEPGVTNKLFGSVMLLR